MARAGAAIGTKLQWIAVDHHDTDNPHTHIIIRGRRANGQDLVVQRFKDEFVKRRALKRTPGPDAVAAGTAVLARLGVAGEAADDERQVARAVCPLLDQEAHNAWTIERLRGFLRVIDVPLERLRLVEDEVADRGAFLTPSLRCSSGQAMVQ